MSQDNTFSWSRDFKNVNWQATLKYNLFRSIGAGIVWCILGLVSGAGMHALPMLIAFPIGYFIFLLPVGLITGWLSAKGVPWVGLVNFLFALILFVGDPLVFFLKKMQPALVPVDKPRFFNFKLVIFIINEPAAPPVQAEPRELSAAMFNKG